MLFEIKDLTKVYGNRTVLDIPELSFEKGIVYSLLGPNGSGKTTLLEILSLLAPPTTGVVRYNGSPIDFLSNNLTALRREIVMVQQNPVLFTTTVYKNLDFGLKVRGVPKAKRRRLIEEALDLVGMRGFIHAEANRLSGGETQRVAIARAIVCSPKVILFDEPTSNVDAENQSAIESILAGIHSQKQVSVIFTTHNLTQASRLSQRIISLFEGRAVPSLFENIFSVNLPPGNEQFKSCLIQDTIKVSVKTNKIGSAKLSIDPRLIQLEEQPAKDNRRNSFNGRVTQLAEEKDHARIVVDIGITLHVLTREDVYRSRPFLVGDKVTVSCPDESIQVL
ncbi:MAG: ATP-binding cassette domain-containing protein [Deltaproteobacteria bacterium]|nr:ATP-binding cassette domain-containing protein [Deltaproteobacteria bacterium]